MCHLALLTRLHALIVPDESDRNCMVLLEIGSDCHRHQAPPSSLRPLLNRLPLLRMLLLHLRLLLPTLQLLPHRSLPSVTTPPCWMFAAVPAQLANCSPVEVRRL